MEEAFTKGSDWFDIGSGDILLKELLDDESYRFLLLSKDAVTGTAIDESRAAPPSNERAINHLVSTVYSGPTILDIENALSITNQVKHQSQLSISQARISLLEGGSGTKLENNKFTMKLKSCGNGVTDDGYKWRKYGQKSIKNSPYPRSYYKCTNPRCGAKKQVEKSSEDEDTLIITYEGLHLHFVYPYFLPNQSYQDKRTKLTPTTETEESQTTTNQTQQAPEEVEEEAQDFPSHGTTKKPVPTNDDYSNGSVGFENLMGSQGLLEDMVPFCIRNPSRVYNNGSASNISSCSSCLSSTPASPSSWSWSPNHNSLSCFDVGFNDSI